MLGNGDVPEHRVTQGNVVDAMHQLLARGPNFPLPVPFPLAPFGNDTALRILPQQVRAKIVRWELQAKIVRWELQAMIAQVADRFASISPQQPGASVIWWQFYVCTHPLQNFQPK